MSTAVAKSEKAEATGLVVDGHYATSLLEDAGEGVADHGQDDVALPFLKLLQALSPECVRGKPQYMPDARPGDWINSLTRQLFSGEKPIRIVRVSAEKKFLEWRPMNAGGGLVRVSKTREEAEKHKVPSIGNPDTDTEIIDTAEVYCLMDIGNEQWRPVVLAWSKSKLKTYRAWNGLLQEQTFEKHGIAKDARVIPVAGIVYALEAESVTKTKGTFFNPKVTVAGVTDGATYAAAKALRQIAQSGKVSVIYEDVKEDAADAVPGGDEVPPPPMQSGY